MYRSKPEDIIHGYFIRLKKFSGQIGKNANEKAIHRFRVEVKKLRAFLRLLSTELNEPHAVKLPRKIKKMYAALGKIRDAQLHQKKLKSSVSKRGMPVNYLQVTGKNKWWRQLLSSRQFDEEEIKLVRKIPAVIRDDSIKTFFVNKKENIAAIIRSGQYRDKELHSIRKYLKDMIYISGLWHELKRTSPFIFQSGSEMEKAENLAQSLGIFNDSCKALSFLAPPVIKAADEQDQQVLWAARRKWLAERRQLKKDVLLKLNTDLL